MFQASLSVKQLICRLLHRDAKNRLGSREGANEIKRHPFFRGVNWALVRCMVNYKQNLISAAEHILSFIIMFIEKLHFITYPVVFQHPPELEASLFLTVEPEKDANNKAPDLDIKALDLSVF